MAIPGQQSINIGLPNEPTGSDSLYTAFTKTNTNFTTLFANASSFTAGNGIAISNSVISANLVAGNNNPTVAIDAYGKITSASNNIVSGTVTSVNLTAGTGVSVSGGPITTAGSIIVTNTGVTRLNAGDNISLNSSNGNITVTSTAGSGTVESVGVTSSTLTVTSSPITSIGSIGVEFNTVPVYTVATKPGTGVVGQLIAISDSTPGGKMAYYDTTNTRWSYVSDDSAV